MEPIQEDNAGRPFASIIWFLQIFSKQQSSFIHYIVVFEGNENDIIIKQKKLHKVTQYSEYNVNVSASRR
jgi:hypothetical protein